MVESTRLESERTGNRTVGSNPTLSAIFPIWFLLVRTGIWDLYLFCTLFLVIPHCSEIGFQLFLA